MKLFLFNKMQKTHFVSIVTLIFLCLLFRFIAIWFFPQAAPDSGEYLEISENILSGAGFSLDGIHPTDYRAPGYPFFLASIQYFTGDNLLNIRVVQALLDSITAFIIFVIAYNIFDFFVGCLALSIYSIHPSLIGATTFVLSESLTVFFLSLCALLLLYSLKYRKYKYSFTAGLLLGLSTLVRPFTLPFPVFLLIISFFFFARNKFILKSNLLLCIGFVLCLSPWIVRNYIAFNQFIPVSSNLGGNLYIASNEKWDGTYNPEIMMIRSTIQKQLNSSGAHYPIDNELKRRALATIQKEPFQYVRLSFKRIFRLWLHAPGEQLVLKDKPWLRNCILIFHYGLLAVFLIGLIALFARNEFRFYHLFLMLIPLYTTLIHSMLVALPRFRIPSIPIIIIFAAYGLSVIIKTFFYILQGDCKCKQ